MHKFLLTITAILFANVCYLAPTFAASDIDLLITNNTNHDFHVHYGNYAPCTNLQQDEVIPKYSTIQTKMDTRCIFALDYPTLNISVSLTSDYQLILTGCQYQKFHCSPKDRTPQDTSKDKRGVIIFYQ
jgi:hypothetical protein